MHYSYKTFSNQGKRQRNEDDYFPHQNEEHHNLFMVLDGVGGHGDGDLASAFVQNELSKALLEEKRNGEIVDAVHETDLKLKRYAAQVGNTNMGSTVALLKFNNTKAHICWVGDSRVYHIRKGEILYRTKDHTMLELMKDCADLNFKEEDNQSIKHIIYQALGPQGSKLIPSEVTIEDVQHADQFLLATDGLLDAFTDEELTEVIRQNKVDVLAELYQKCLHSSKDNFTFTLVNVHE